MAVETRTPEQIVHVRHEEWVEHRLRELDVSEMTGTLEVVQVACLADVVLFHRPQHGVIETACRGVLRIVEKHWVADLLHGHCPDLRRRQKREGGTGDGRGDCACHVHDGGGDDAVGVVVV